MPNSEAANNPGLPLPPPLLLLFSLAAAIALEFLLPLAVLPAPAWRSPASWLGFAVLAGAVGLAAAAILTFRRAGTPVDPRRPALKLADSGPFRFSRNPMYLALTGVLLGLSLIFSLDWGMILTPVLWFAFDRLIVSREEAYLTKTFGTSYTDFMARTRRWL